LDDLRKRRAKFEDERPNGNDGEHFGQPIEFDAAIRAVYAKKAKLWDEYWRAFPEEKKRHDAEQAAISAQQAAHYKKMDDERLAREYA